MSAVFLLWHLGLGDAIICNGLVRMAAKMGAWDKIILPAKPHNLATVRWMFSDLPTVEVVAVDNDDDMIRKCRPYFLCKLGLHSANGLREKEWDKAFYEDAGVPFECRWSEFNLPLKRDEYTPLTNDHFFVHHDVKRGYIINRGKSDAPLCGPPPYIPDNTTEMRHHVPWLGTAREIHVIDSCFLCLADSIATNANRLVLHRYATAKDPYKRLGPPTLRKNWEIIE